LTDADLKRLDEKLRKMLDEKHKTEMLKRSLTEHQDEGAKSHGLNSNDSPQGNLNNLVLPDLNKQETMSVNSRHSRMSGASHLSKFNEHGVGTKSNPKDEFDDFDSLSISSNKKPVKRMDFSNDGDEWNAICVYNHKMFEEEKKINKLKDLEIKRRTKDDLDNQIRQKLKRLNEEQLKNLEYDQILLNHTQFLSELERQKQMEFKAKVLREKENRDKQLKDEKLRKRAELNKEKKYEKELVKHLMEEIEREKQEIIKRKIQEKEVLQKTLKDNELNKIKQLERIKKEKMEDVKSTEEYAKIIEKQENERKEYFKKIERNSNSYASKMVETVLKDMNIKNQEEEEKMRKYLADKERR
jgi:hypothetical protein